MSKRTLGPWKSGSMVQHTPSVYGPEGQVIAIVSGISNGGRGRHSTPEGKANQRLIAAAPDLLAVAEALVHSCDAGVSACVKGDDGQLIHVFECRAARDAIAKVEGRS